MKLTPDTKLSELIPEGYEISQQSYGITSGKVISNTNTIVIFIRKKSERKLEYFAIGYAEIINYKLSEMNRFQDKIKNKDFDSIFMSDRIGLLKYVCKYYNISWIDILSYYSNRKNICINTIINYKIMPEKYEDLIKILTSEFIESILKE